MSTNFRRKETSPNHCWYEKTIDYFCYLTVKTAMILSPFVCISLEYERVTDRQSETDGRTDGIAVANTALCALHCNKQCGRAVKIIHLLRQVPAGTIYITKFHESR